MNACGRRWLVPAASFSIIGLSCSSLSTRTLYAEAAADTPTPDVLEKAIVICRHGDRTPLLASLGAKVPATPSQDRLWASKLPSQHAISNWSCLIFPLADHPREDIRRAFGVYGQLTRKGVVGTRELGRSLRNRYTVGPSPLLPLAFDPSVIHLRSTNYNRTVQSVQNVALGLYPDISDYASTHDAHAVTMEVRPSNHETLIPPRRCARIPELVHNVCLPNRSLGVIPAELSTLRALAPDVTTLGDLLMHLYGIPHDRFTFSKAHEVLHCHAAHQVQDFPHISEALVHTVASVCAAEWKKQYESSFELLQLTTGPLLQDISGLLTHNTTGCSSCYPSDSKAAQAKLCLWAAHDSTIIPILIALDRFDGVTWPHYQASLTFEAWRNPQDDSQSIRVLYNEEVIRSFSITEWREFIDSLAVPAIQTACASPFTKRVSVHP